MLAITETAYPQLATSFEVRELEELFTPSTEEITFVTQHAIDQAGRVALLGLLKVCQHLGYFPMWTIIPKEIPTYLAQYLGYLFCPEIPTDYDLSGTRSRHIKNIRSFLGIQPVGNTTYAKMKEAALRAANTKEHLADIVNVMIEELIYQCFELPAFSRLDRMARSARIEVNKTCFEKVSSQLTSSQKLQLDQFLFEKSENEQSGWVQLKYAPEAPTTRNIKRYLAYLNWLKQHDEQFKIKIDLPEAKRQQFAYEAYTCDITHLRQLKAEKRYTFMLIVLQEQMSKGYDNLVLMFIRKMFKLRNDAKMALAEYHEKSRQQVGQLIEHLAQIGIAYQTEGNMVKRFKAIEAVMPKPPNDMVEQCHMHLAYLQNNYLLCLLPLYKNKRALLFNCLEQFDLKSSSQDSALLYAISLIRSNRNSRKEWIASDEALFSTKQLPERWRKLITGKKVDSVEVNVIHRKYAELWVFFELARQFESGDVFLSNALQYDDFTKQFISWREYREEIEEFEVVSGIPVSAQQFVEKVKNELLQTAYQTDHSFPNNQYARMEEGKLILTKLAKKKSREDYAEIDQLLKNRMKPIGILQLLNHTEKWLNLHQGFHHFSGKQSRIEDYPQRFVSTLFCYGSLMGPSQAARAIKGIKRKQLAWIHDHHIHEGRLNKAINEVINTYQQFQLPHFWGSGEHASADGTHWSTYQKNLFSQYHLRYGAYGGVGYYHVSDTYIALFSHFIPCGVYEALYILDGLFQNESDIKPHILHGDTHAQSTVVFGLAYLLGIKLMPRIRDIKRLIFFRPDKTSTFKHIDSLFSEPINWKLIEKHLPDMLRVVLSIKKGKITPSTILRRLGSHSRKNKLYYAFRELGRAVRTIFLLEYIEDLELRRLIFAATNKSEEFNQFSDWVAFANKTIPENLRHEQSKII